MFPSKSYFRLDYVVKRSNTTYIIEIIGPAGIGKSTFIKQLKRKGIIRRYSAPRLNIKDAVKNKNSNLSFHAKLFRLKVEKETQEGKGLSRFQDMLQWLFRDQYLQLPQNQGKIFIVDEGLGHHFTSELLVAAHSDPDLFHAATKNRGIIALKAKPKTMAERIMARKEKTKHILPYHQDKNADQLEAYLNERLMNIKSLVSAAQRAGIPCMEINLEEDVALNLKKVESFLTTFS